MIIPYDQISSAALQGLIEEFVTRDGTDYGEQETSLAERVTAVRGRLQRGEAVILFSEGTGQCNIVLRQTLSN